LKISGIITVFALEKPKKELFQRAKIVKNIDTNPTSDKLFPSAIKIPMTEIYCV